MSIFLILFLLLLFYGTQRGRNRSRWNFRWSLATCPYSKSALPIWIRFGFEQHRFKVLRFCWPRSISWRFSIYFRPDEHWMRCRLRAMSLNIVRFPDPLNQLLDQVWNDRQNNLLMILKFFSARWTPNAMLSMYKQFWTLCDFCIHGIRRQIGTESTIWANYRQGV